MKTLVAVAGVSFVLSLVFMKAWMALLTKWSLKQIVRTDGPRAHLKKSGTLTMGGVAFYLAFMVTMIIAAMATGVSVIASDIPGNRALVTHEQSGLLVPPRDVRGLSAAMFRLLEQPSLRISLGSRARQVVQENYSLEKMGREHLELIQRLLK